jgi:hypothetical protein
MALSPAEQEWVMDQGFVIASNPGRGTDSAVAMGRCKKVKTPEVQHELRNGRSDNGTQRRCEEFIQVNGLDAACAGVLRQLSPELLQKVMGDDVQLNINQAKGSTSSVVMGRIKRAREEARSGGEPAEKRARTDGGAGGAEGGADLSAAPQSFADGHFQKGSRAADFIQLNELDEFCIRALQTCDPSQLDWIMDRGFKIDATPDEPASSVVSRRMKTAREQVTSYAPSPADLTQRVSDFISINQLDQSCAERLRSLPIDDQQKVLEQGYVLWQVNEGRGNRNSIVMGRMRKVAPRV